MKKANGASKGQFSIEQSMFRDNHDPDYELKNIFEIYLPFWQCRRNVVVERDIEIDRFSKIILQTVQNGFNKHSQVCSFLGIEVDSFVNSQFHFLLKNNLMTEMLLNGDSEYEITYDGLAFLERKKKVTTLETVEFEYVYNDLTLQFMEKQWFDFIISDTTKKIVDTTQPFDSKGISDGKRKLFSGYEMMQTSSLSKDRTEIPHRNRPYNLNKVEFANFFNKQNRELSFYDFENDKTDTHKRSICFLAFEYADKFGSNIYDIRQFKKTVKEFDRHEIEENLSKHATDYLKKSPLFVDNNLQNR